MVLSARGHCGLRGGRRRAVRGHRVFAYAPIGLLPGDTIPPPSGDPHGMASRRSSGMGSTFQAGVLAASTSSTSIPPVGRSACASVQKLTEHMSDARDLRE